MVLVFTALLTLMLVLFLGLGSEVCFARESGRGGNGTNGQNAMQSQAGSNNCGQTEANRESSNRGNRSNRTNEGRENRSNHNVGTHNNQGSSGANNSNCGSQSGNRQSGNNPGTNQQPGASSSQNNNNCGQQGNNDQVGQNNGPDCGNQPGAPTCNSSQNNNPGQQGFNNGSNECGQDFTGSCIGNNDCHHDGDCDCQDGCNNDGCCNNYNQNRHRHRRHEGCNCGCGYENECVNVNCYQNRFECQHRRHCDCNDDCNDDCDDECDCEQCCEHHRERFRMRCGGCDNDCDDCDGNCGDGCDCCNGDGCQHEHQHQCNHCWNWNCGNHGCQCGNGCGCWIRHRWRHRHRHRCHCCCCGCPCDCDEPQDPEVYVVKDGPDMAHEGDTITYTFEVSGNCDLTEVTVVDSLLGPITVYTGDLDNDGVLDVGEVWIYSADYTITSETPDPCTNEVVVTAKYMPCHSISATDTHTLDVLHPEISIDKTVDSSSVNAGDEVLYTYVVVNEGDCMLYDIEVNDDLIGFIGKVDSLAPGASCTFTARDTLLADTVNIGTVVAFDELGDPTGRVTASDDELVIVAAGEPEEPVEPEGPTEPEEPTTSTSQVSQVQAEAQQVAVTTQEDVLPYTGTDLLLYLGMSLVLLMTGLGLRRCGA